MSDEPGPSLLQGLDDFDRRSLREGAAALALWPKNADRHAAIRALIEALAAEPQGGGGTEIGVDEWAAWLGSADAETLQRISPDIIHDAPIWAPATVLGTRQGLLAGQLEFPALHYRLWMRALASASDPQLEAGRGLLTAASSLCNRVVEWGRLEGYKWPDHPQPPGAVAVPPEEKFERLRAALRIEFDDPVIAEILAPLLRDGEQRCWQPLSREAESLILIADPWRFSLAALVRSVGLAAASPQIESVLAEARNAALEVVAAAAREMGWTIEGVGEDHVVARADVDCLAVIGVGVLSPDPAEVEAESVSADGELVEWYGRVASLARSLGASCSFLVAIGDGRGVVSDAVALRGSARSDPWLVGLGEFQAMGEALRMDPLALPEALKSLARPPWAEGFDLLDAVGRVRQDEESLAPADRVPDDTEYMLMRGRMMATRHPAPAPDMGGWIEVTRWEGAEDPAIFCSSEWDEFALLVRGYGRYFWITCPGTLERRYELLPVVATVLAFWLARLFEQGFLAPPAHLEDPLFTRFRLELDPRPGPQLALAQGERDTRILLGPGLIEAMCHGNNESDRTLVGAVVSWGKPSLDEDDHWSLLDQIVPEGQGTVAIWPRPDATSNQPRLDLPPPVEPRFRQEVERGLAAGAVEAGQVLVAAEEQLAPLLETLARSLEGGIQGRIDASEPATLRALVALHERVVHQSLMEALHLPARSVMKFGVTYPDISAASSSRDLVMRVLIERCSALPPQGEEPFGRRIAAALRAATELQLELRGALDAVRWEKAGGRVVVSPEFGIRVDLEGALPGASRAMSDQVLTAAPDRMAEVHSDWWGELPEFDAPQSLDEPIALEGDWAEVDLAMAAEWGVGLEQTLRLLHALAEIADEQPDCVGCAPAERVEAELAERTAIPAAAVARAVERLTLSPCPGYDTFEEEYRPGRANRERSYLRRPLVMLHDGDLCWSTLHCKRSGEYLGSLIASGRLRASGSLGAVVRGFSQRLDREFEDTVLAAVHDCGWQGRVRVERLDGVALRRGRGEPIGDVDVLAWSPERKEVWLLDAKRLNPGVEPGPMLREGGTFEKYAERHEERLGWVRDHLTELAREIGVESTEDWEIRAALVLDRPLAGAHLAPIPMPIWTLWALPRELSGERPDG